MLLTIVAFIFVLSVVVLVHEFGHFIVAKMNNVYVITFSIGFGPKILKKRLGETEYAVSVIPFGGYVKFAGEIDDHEEEEEEGGEPTEEELIERAVPENRRYRSKSPLQKMMIVVAGPVMNAILALVLYIGSIWVQGLFKTEPASVVVKVTEQTPAMEAGFKRGDRIIEINGKSLSVDRNLNYYISENHESEIVFTVRRDGEEIKLACSPYYDEELEKYRIGIESGIPPRIGDVKRDGPAWEAGIRKGALVKSINDTTVVSYNEMVEKIHNGLGRKLHMVWAQDGVEKEGVVEPEAISIPTGDSDEVEIIEAGSIGIVEYYEEYRVSFVEAVRYGSRAYWQMILAILDFLKKLVTGKATIKAIGGPLRIGQMAGDMIRFGFGYLISFIGFFSLNLAIFNLLPILPFDGGHFVLYLYELVSRRPVNARLKNIMMQVGFIILMILMGLIVVIDIFNVFG